MAVLPDADRHQIWARYMSDLSSEGDPLPLLKAELRAAVDAIDGWVDDNAAAFNAAIPLPARTALTARQKARLLAFVIRRRFEVS
jgi:hypothetical protein